MSNKDLTNLLGLLNIQDNQNEAESEIEKSPEAIKEQLEKEEQYARVQQLFDSGKVTVMEGVDIEGNVINEFYDASTKNTPINDLIELCDADLPYLDEQTQQDYKNFKKHHKIVEREYNPEQARKSEIEKLFGG